MKDIEIFVQKLEKFIEAIIIDKSSDHVEDRVTLNEVRQDLIDFFKGGF